MKITNAQLKVVGITFKNEDGTNRQDIIKSLSNDAIIILKREPHNQYDKNAIAVFSLNGQIGYIGKDYASAMANLMDKGIKFVATIDKLDTYKDTTYIHLLINEV